MSSSLFCSWILGHFSNWKWVNFLSKIAKFSKKIDFFTPASTVNRKNLGPYQSEILLPSARAAKTLQFGHKFHANWSIQSQDMLKSVKNVKIVTEIEAVI